MSTSLTESFYALFNGHDHLIGSGEGWKMAAKYLADHTEEQGQIAEICIMLLDKPRDVLLTGTRKNMRLQGVQAISSDLALFLPKHEGRVGEDLPQGVPGVWKNVNFSMCRRIAVICLKMDIGGKVKDRWFQKYGVGYCYDDRFPGWKRLRNRGEGVHKGEGERILLSILAECDIWKHEWLPIFRSEQI